MAQTHRDDDQNEGLKSLLDKLQPKAEEMTRLRENLITAGKPQEEAIRDMRGSHYVRQLPPDEDGVTRISIGGHPDHPDTRYLTFRGKPQEVIERLIEALQDMQRFVTE